MRKPVIEYNFLQNYYIDNKYVYEALLCELLNKSKSFTKQYGENFTIIKEQNNGQVDVKSMQTGYEIDFKLMISESLKEFQVRSSPLKQKFLPELI